MFMANISRLSGYPLQIILYGDQILLLLRPS